MKISATKRIALIVVILAAMLATPSFSQGNRGHHQSGINGRVLVEQILLHSDWHVRITTGSDDLVADIETADDGSFTANLKPGTYVLTPVATSGAWVGPSVSVTVAKKEFSTVQMPLFIIIFPWPWPPILTGDVVLWTTPHYARPRHKL